MKEKLKEIRGIGNVCIEIVGEVIYIASDLMRKE
jgi:hypothetical protein